MQRILPVFVFALLFYSEPRMATWAETASCRCSKAAIKISGFMQTKPGPEGQNKARIIFLFFGFAALLIGLKLLLVFYSFLLPDRWQASNIPPCTHFQDVITKANIALTRLAISQALAVGHALSFALAHIITCYCTQLLVDTGSCQWPTVPPRRTELVPQRLHVPPLWSHFLG